MGLSGFELEAQNNKNIDKLRRSVSAGGVSSPHRSPGAVLRAYGGKTGHQPNSSLSREGTQGSLSSISPS